MATGFRKYVPALLFSAVIATVGCSDSDPLVGPTSTTGLQGPAGALVAVEPAMARAEFRSDSVCPTAPPFGVRVVVILSDRIVIARRLRFELTRHMGEPAVPLVIPLQRAATAGRPVPGATPLPTPTQSAIPIPGGPAIPLPGSAPVEDLLLSVRRLPFLLEFGCDVPPAGTLVATLDTTDDRGTSRTSAMRVRVGG